MVAHNNPIQSAHLRKKWQFHVKTWFDQPAKKAARSAARVSKAKKVHPKPTQKLRPVVRCQTNKYNTKARAGRGFTPAEINAAGMNITCCRTYGVSVDFRRKNRSEEGFKVNVDRLKAYKSKLVVFPVNGKVKKLVASEADVAAATQFKGTIMPVRNTVAVETARAPTADELAKKGKVVNMMRQALMAKKLYGRRVKKVQKQQANKAAADKKAAKNTD